MRPRRVKIALRLPAKPVKLLYYARSVAVACASSSIYASVEPPIAVFESHIETLQELQAATLSRARGTAAVRDAQAMVVRGDLKLIASGVQRIADQFPADVAVAIITGAGFDVARVGAKNKAQLKVTQGRGPGIADLLAKSRGRQQSYLWQYSLDGKRWIDVDPTTACKTTIPGLTPALLYFFRFRCRGPKGLSDWSQVVSFRVL
jgi:hypothetical protein